MKYKTLTREQLIVSIDRLTRFKNPKIKYMRVFSDILLSCLLEPKYKKNEIEKLSQELITDYVTEIINKSIEKYTAIESFDKNINEKLKKYENSIFNIDDDIQVLLNNKINYSSFIGLVDNNSSVNLRWLKTLYFTSDVQQNRESNCLKFPVEKVLLVEGITEEILLPVFAKILGYDFYKYGIQVIGAGGKNQVVKMYYQLVGELKIPVFILLDRDAEENIKQITPKLRKQDKVHLVSCGEFEDLLPKSLINKAISMHLKNFVTITEDELENFFKKSEFNNSTVKALEEFFRLKGLHEFKKAEFAKIVKENIETPSDISKEICEIINELKLSY